MTLHLPPANIITDPINKRITLISCITRARSEIKSTDSLQ